MSNGYFHFAEPKNEPVLSYAHHTPERKALKKALADLKAEIRDIPMYIGDQQVFSGEKREIRPPHETNHLLGHFHEGTAEHINRAIDAVAIREVLLFGRPLYKTAHLTTSRKIQPIGYPEQGYTYNYEFDSSGKVTKVTWVNNGNFQRQYKFGYECH